MGQDLPSAGTWVRIDKAELQAVLDRLRDLGYRVIGPTLAEAAVVYSDVDSLAQLPIGVIDEQDGGKYRLHQTGSNSYFDYVVGPHSLKNFLFPPRETLLQASRSEGRWEMRAADAEAQRLAVIGVRSCDLHALRVQDLVFLGGPFTDPLYAARRAGLFVAAVNCRRAAATCFCHSMRTGPAVELPCDLALTELEEHFAIEVKSPRGAEALATARWTACTAGEIEAARELPRRLHETLCRRPVTNRQRSDGEPRGRSLHTDDLHDLLLGNLEHPRWDEVAQRCLACTNCTLVCPTCFCSRVQEVTDLTGDQVRRERAWDSCFTLEHSAMSGGSVRVSTRSRYRQWLTHKLATWIDQFGTSGCIGCGRCITWCPVGIDLTEEVAAIRGETS